jgi:hypothetical protein
VRSGGKHVGKLSEGGRCVAANLTGEGEVIRVAMREYRDLRSRMPIYLHVLLIVPEKCQDVCKQVCKGLHRLVLCCMHA